MRKSKLYLIGLLLALSIQAILSQSSTENLLLHNYHSELSKFLIEHYNEIHQDEINEVVTEFKHFESLLFNQERVKRIVNEAASNLLEMKDYHCAILIYELNTELHPYSWKLYDQLAKAYYLNKEYQKAIESYKKALVFNSLDEEDNNEEVVIMIDKIQAHLRSTNDEK